MSRRFFDYDPFLGTTEFFHYDPATGNGFIEMVEDETALRESNRRSFNSFTSGRDRWGGEGLEASNKVLSLSVSMTQKLQQRGVLMDPVRLMAWADTDEAIPYRTRPGRLKGTYQ